MVRPIPLTEDEVREALDRALSGGVVEPWVHCIRRMRQRGVDMLDVRRCLASGAVAGVEWNEEYGHWRYRIDALDVDGYELTAIVAVSATGFIEVVTVF